jgi:glucose/mannose-6-phosphate isomerase
MDLNDNKHFPQIDRSGMIEHINGLPQQLLTSWRTGLGLTIPEMSPVSSIVVAGMGGSAIGADLVASYLADRLQVPMVIHRDYGLPAFAHGRDSLVVISSHSGNTEESLSAYEQALRNRCQLVTISTGGQLHASASAAGLAAWKFNHSGQPRTAVGFSFGLLLALIVRMGLISDPAKEVEAAVGVMEEQQVKIKAELPVLSNPAKRLAGQLMGRHVTIFGSSFMVPVARRWKSQLNEVAKAMASFEAMPEADHNTLAGTCNPPALMGQELAIFLMAAADNERNQLRVEKTREIFMLEGVGTDFYRAKGDSRLAQMWSALLFGDYVSYYLALAYDNDPTPIPPIAALKEALSN